MTLNSLKFTLALTGLVTGDAGAAQTINEAFSAVYSDGTGTNKANCVVVKKDQSLNATNVDIDLAGGLTAFDGSTVTFTKIHGIFLYHKSGTNLTISQAASNGMAGIFTGGGHGVKIKEKGIFPYIAPDGVTVTAGTGDKLNLAADADSVYTLVVWGEV